MFFSLFSTSKGHFLRLRSKEEEAVLRLCGRNKAQIHIYA